MFFDLVENCRHSSEIVQALYMCCCLMITSLVMCIMGSDRFEEE